MLEIKVCDNAFITEELFKKENIKFGINCFAVRAMQGENCLGYVIFNIEDEKETVFAVFPENDILLADGLIRSALHIGCERGIKEGYYNKKLYHLLKKIDFVENKEENKLKFQNLFTNCCCCNKN